MYPASPKPNEKVDTTIVYCEISDESFKEMVENGQKGSKYDLEKKISESMTALKRERKVIQFVIEESNRSLEAIKTIDANFEIVNKKLDSLQEHASNEFGKVGDKLEGLHTEISKIQKVSNYSQGYENLLKISRK